MSKNYVIISKKILKCHTKDYTSKPTKENECRITSLDYEKQVVNPSDPTTIPKSAEPGQVTSIIMHFKEHTGDYVWHCHILEHEDNDMMRPLVVVK